MFSGGAVRLWQVIGAAKGGEGGRGVGKSVRRKELPRDAPHPNTCIGSFPQTLALGTSLLDQSVGS